MQLGKTATKRRVTFRPIESKVLGPLTGVLEVRYRRRLLGQVCLMRRRDGINYWEYRGEGGFDLGAPEMDELEIAKERLLAQVREWRKRHNRRTLRRIAQWLVAGTILLAFYSAGAMALGAFLGLGTLSAVPSIVTKIAIWSIATWGLYKGWVWLDKAATVRRVTFRRRPDTQLLEVRYGRRLLGVVYLVVRSDGTSYWEYRGEHGFDLGAPGKRDVLLARERLLAKVEEWRKSRNRTTLQRAARYLVAGVLAFLIATGYGLLDVSSILPRLLGTAAWIVAAWGIYKGGDWLFDKLKLNDR